MDFTAASSEYMDCGVIASEIGIDGANAKTLMGWANCHNFSLGTEGCPFQIGGSGSGSADELFALRVTSTDSQWRADYWDTFIQFSTPTTSVNTWWHFAMTYDGTTGRVYANGVDEGDQVIALTTSDDFGMYGAIWEQATNIDFFDGEIADLRVYDRALSEAEIMTIYMSRGKDGIVNGLEGRWPMNDGLIGGVVPSTFVDATEEAISSSASTTLDVPNNTDGDLLVACIGVGGDSGGDPAEVVTPSGWTFVATVDAPSALSTPSLWLYERTASSEPGSYVWTFNQTCTHTSHMNCYQNVETTADVFGTASDTTTSANSPSVTFSSAGGAYLVIRFAVIDGGALPADPWPSGVNQRNHTEATGVGNGCGLICADHIRSSTSSGVKTFTIASDEWASVTVAYKASPSIRDVSGSANHPHDADAQSSPDRTAGVLRI